MCAGGGSVVASSFRAYERLLDRSHRSDIFQTSPQWNQVHMFCRIRHWFFVVDSFRSCTTPYRFPLAYGPVVLQWTSGETGTRTRSVSALPVGAYKAPARPSSGISPGRKLAPSEPDSRPAKDFSESGSLR
jgi:hypothetical protein